MNKMAENQYVKELLHTGVGTEGSLLIPKKIFDTLIPEVAKTLIPRSEASLYFGPADIPGSSIDIDLETPNALKIRLVAESAEIPLDNGEYTTTNIKPLKYGVSIRITREMLEDAKWNLLQQSIQTAGRRFAENENALVITALDGATNTVAGGAAATIANITRAIQYLEDSDYVGTTLAVGNEFLNDIRNIDTFVEADKLGSREMIERGFIGTVYGLNVIRVSTNAGMTTTSAYVFDNREAYFIAEKRGITIENFDLPAYDMSAAAITQRIAAKIRRASAVAKITTS